MAQAYPLIRSSLLSQFPVLVTKLGGPLEDILEESGLSLEQIEQPKLLIPFEKQIRLLQVAARKCDCETFALQLAQRQDIAVFGALSVLVMNCPSVAQALQVFAKYLHYTVQGVDLELKQTGELGYFIVGSPYDAAIASQQFWDHALALAVAVMRITCGQSWAPRCTHLKRPEPQDASGYGRYFRSAMAFDKNTIAAGKTMDNNEGSFANDYLIIGSGFRGSVSALRLSEKGHRVGVLETGRRYEDKDYALSTWDVHKYL